MEYIKRLFTFSPPREQYGPTGLPKDVEDDLRSKVLRKEEDDNDNKISLPDTSFEKDLSTVFRGFDDIFKEIFKDMDSGRFQVPFSLPNEELNDGEEIDQEDTLRNKMLDNQQQQHTISPFQKHKQYDNDEETRAFSFNITPFFQPPIHEDETENKNPHHRFPFSMFPWKPFFSDKEFIPDNRDNEISSAFKYSTVTKKINPDGSVETTRKRRDSDGNVEEIITRTIGEQTHTLIKKHNNEGEQETSENYINMNEQDLKKFEEKWKEKKQEKLRSDLLISSPDCEEEV